MSKSSTAKKSNKNTYYGLDLQGNKVYRNSRLVRFLDYHPTHHFQPFCYNLLLKKIHFRNEDELLSFSHKEWTYFHECIARGIIERKEDIEELVAEYGKSHLSSSTYIAEVNRQTQLLISDDIWNIICNTISSRNIDSPLYASTASVAQLQ
jgi:hypothetical protein